MTRKHTYIKTQFALSISPFPSLSLFWFEDGTAGGFPGGSEDKASACNAGDLGSIPGLGRFPGEGNGNPLP